MLHLIPLPYSPKQRGGFLYITTFTNLFLSLAHIHKGPFFCGLSIFSRVSRREWENVIPLVVNRCWSDVKTALLSLTLIQKETETRDA